MCLKLIASISPSIYIPPPRKSGSAQTQVQVVVVVDVGLFGKAVGSFLVTLTVESLTGPTGVLWQEKVQAT